MPRALLVTTERSRGTLAAARALSRAGWFVGVGTPSGRGMPVASRAASARHQVPRPRDGSAFVAAVNDATAAQHYDLVFGGADDWAGALAHHRDKLDVRVGHAPVEAMTRVFDKVEITRAASRHGIDAPRTVVADAEQVEAWQSPAVVKSRTHWWPDMAHRLRIEAVRTDSLTERRAAVADVERRGGIPVLQELVEGRLMALTGVYCDGHLRSVVQQVAGGLWPTPMGVSAHARTVEVDRSLVTRVDQLLAELGWEGLVEVQFVLDGDGRPWLLDCNPRFYGSLALAVAAGVNLPDVWGRWLLDGTPPPDVEGRPGTTYQWFPGDLRRACAERRGGLLADVWATLRRSLRAEATSVLSLRDPGPALVPLLDRLRPRG